MMIMHVHHESSGRFCFWGAREGKGVHGGRCVSLAVRCARPRGPRRQHASCGGDGVSWHRYRGWRRAALPTWMFLLRRQ